MAMFERLVSGLHEEIVRRDATYWQRFAIEVPTAESVRERLPEYFAEGDAELCEHYAAGLSQLRAAGLRLEQGDKDPLGGMIAVSLLDAARAHLGQLDLHPQVQDVRPLQQVLEQDYAMHRLADGRACFVARHGSVPLLIVNALGFPVHFWRPLLLDRESALRPVLVESRCCSLFDGGMQTPAGLSVHADDLLEVLDAAGLERAAVLGWCNGGRIAVDFAARFPQRVSALVLLSPTFRGAQQVAVPPSAFEENMQHILAKVAGSPKIAPIVSKMLRQMLKPPEWDKFADAGTRARALLGQADQSLVEALVAPLKAAADVLNTVKRNALDEEFPVLDSLAAIDKPLFVVLGDCDNVVSNAETLAAMQVARRPHFAHVQGAGHYVHHLQYPYLRHVLSQCLQGSLQPRQRAAARVRMEAA